MTQRKLPRMGPVERRTAGKARRMRSDYEAAVAKPDPDDHADPFRLRLVNPPSALFVAATLSLARLVDETPNLLDDWRAGRPILIDVPDRTMFEEIRSTWRAVLAPEDGKVLYLDKATYGELRSGYIATALFVAEPPKTRQGPARDLLGLLGWGLPCLGVSPSAKSCLPPALVAAARHHLVLPGLEPVVVGRTIALVTGEPCGLEKLLEIRFPISIEHLALAVRHGRTPVECVSEIVRLQVELGADRSRSLTLDQLHGLDPAVAWARSTIADLQAWRHGEIGWDAIDHGVVLDGPPGTGKTLFAQVFASEAGLPLVAGSLSKWQGRGHLGDLLKGMRGDFAKARSLAPCVLFIDEVDAFGDRNSFRHEHADYSIQVVNGFIECLDGIDGRTGLIFLAASNRVERCDPAIVRSGRLNRIIRIGLPDEPAREAMLRVRLGSDLPHVDLGEIAAATEGFSGADLEKLAKDAKRIARQSKRPMMVHDLLAVLDREQRPPSPALRERVAVHESGHALTAVLLHGPEGVRVTVRGRGDNLGHVSARRRDGMVGTREDLEGDLLCTLAGRAAEEIVLGSPSAGAGGIRGSDLEQATRIAAAMVGSLGLAGPHPVVFVAEADDTPEILSYGPLRQATEELLRTAYGRALGLMRVHRPALARIAAELAEKKQLGGDDIARLMAEVEGCRLERSA